MLLFDKRLLKTTRLNQVVVPVYSEDDKDQMDDPIGYLYSDLSTYQQVVTLSVRFEDDVDALRNVLIFDLIHSEAVDYWKTVVPKPFNMLAPYLGLITDKIEMRNEISDLAGYMHVLGKSINFANFIEVPKAARVNVLFGKSSFSMMKEELDEYRKTLRERELCDNVEDVTWVSTEEIARVIQVASCLGGFNVNVSTQTPVVNQEIATIEVDENGLDTTIDLSDDWSDYTPPKFNTDWDSPNPMVANDINAINEESKKIAANSDQEPPIDLLARMTQGTVNSHNV